MTSSAQARFDKLFQNKSKPQAPKVNNGPHFSEKELLAYRQNYRAEGQSNTLADNQGNGPSPSEDSSVRAQGPSNCKLDSTNAPITKPASARSRLNAAIPRHLRPPEHIPGTNPDEIVYLRKGRSQGGLANTKLDDDCGDEEDETEPVSSSNELIGRFCLFSQVVKFPYKYLQDPDDQVSRRFFAAEKVYERKWHMHYVLAPEELASKPIMLVPLDQVKTLVQEISSQFRVHVDVPPYPFTLSFFNDCTPKPISLGVIDSKQEMLEAQSRVPMTSRNYDILPGNANSAHQQDYAAWKEKAERALEAEKRKKGAIKRKRNYQRDMMIMENCNQLKRAQRYLGLRQRIATVQVVRPGLSIEQQQFQQLNDAGHFINPLDVHKVAPFPFEDETVILAVDVEAWEEDHKLITEIGISTLDTTDLAGIAPGVRGEKWIRMIRSRHFRIKGRERLRNVKYCHGHPDMFQFGTSEFVTISQAAEAIDSCFETPYSAGFECAGPPEVDEEGLPIQRTPAKLDLTRSSNDAGKSRNLLLVGQDIKSDIDYLADLGSTIFGADPSKSQQNAGGSPSRRQKVLSSVRERLDTASLDKSLNKGTQPRSLAKICLDLDITTWYAHNAGNDARYTLEAFIKLVIKSKEQDDATAALEQEKGGLNVKRSLREIQNEQRTQVKIEAARTRIKAELAMAERADAARTSQQSSFPSFAPQGTSNANTEASANTDKTTYEKATRRYLEKVEAPMSTMASDDLWGSPAITTSETEKQSALFSSALPTRSLEDNTNGANGEHEKNKREDKIEVRSDNGQDEAESDPDNWAPY